MDFSIGDFLVNIQSFTYFEIEFSVQRLYLYLLIS